MSVLCIPVHADLRISSFPPRFSNFVLFENYCRWHSTTSGAGAFTVGAAFATDITGPHDVPENCAVINGNLYNYYAQDALGIQWERGRGAYNTATDTLARTTVFANSDGTDVAIAFDTLPIVDLFPNPAKITEVGITTIFEAGTKLTFQQTNAPTGWTKDTTHNDKTFRVVSGSASSGGSNSFSTVMAQTTVGNTSLSSAQNGTHAHSSPTGGGFVVGDAGATNGLTVGGTPPVSVQSASTQNSGSGSNHLHGITMNIQYVDLILASKD